MNSSIDLFNGHRGLAEVIALEYTNIPGALPSESLSEAHQALLRASNTFDQSRGDFSHYAARSVRNALNSFYAKSLRRAKIFPKSLDDAPAWDRREDGVAHSSFGAGIEDSRENVLVQVRRRESATILEEVLRFLTPRERVVVEGLRSGQSFSEIGDGMGISKQAAHKVSTSALQKLRDRMSLLGYQGLDSQGLLKSLSSNAKGVG